MHWSVRTNYRLRTVSFALVFIAVGAHLLDRGAGLVAGLLLALQFLVYPHLMYWRAKRSSNPQAAERFNMVFDIMVIGAWIAALQFPLWITFVLCLSTLLNITISWGARAIVLAVLALACGALIAIAIFGLHVSPDTSWPVTLICGGGLTAYLLALANTAYTVNKQLGKTRSSLRASEQSLQAINETLQRQLAENKVLHDQLSEQAIRDPLTGLYNRRYLESIAARELARCRRDAQCLCIVMIDLDHFKHVNDTYGHPAGDAVLKKLATMLHDKIRATDIACRYGGEEFLLLLPNMPPDVSISRAEQWCAEFAAATVQAGNADIQTTLSMGIATYPLHADSIDELIRCADIALYRAKALGRNRAIVYHNDMR